MSSASSPIVTSSAARSPPASRTTRASTPSCPRPSSPSTADGDLHDAFALFRSHGLRRLAVERDGRFVGMITVDDLLVDLAADLADLARPVTGEIVFGQRDAPTPARV